MDLGLCDHVGLTVTPHDPEASRAPSEFQRQAFSYLLENWNHVSATVIHALRHHYEKVRPRYVEFLGDEADKMMPLIETDDELQSLVDLRQIHVHPWSKEGIGYMGLQYGCTWDAEHGLGVMIHYDRIVDLGGADVSFAWKPEEADP